MWYTGNTYTTAHYVGDCSIRVACSILNFALKRYASLSLESQIHYSLLYPPSGAGEVW